LRVRSGGNAADTAAGAGARTITVIGLDSSFNEVTEVLTLAGASASAATSTAFIRLTRAYVETCGTYTGTNTGTIILETTGGTALGYLAAGKSQTQLSMYTVPAGYTAYLRRIRVSGDSSKATTLNLWQRRNADTVAAPFKAKRLVQTWSTIIDSVSTTYEVARSFPAKTDLWATAFVGTGSGFAGINMDILLVKD
jgi:hypothetical protein